MIATAILAALIVTTAAACAWAETSHPGWAALGLTLGGLVLVVWYVLALFG